MCAAYTCVWVWVGLCIFLFSFTFLFLPYSPPSYYSLSLSLPFVALSLRTRFYIFPAKRTEKRFEQQQQQWRSVGNLLVVAVSSLLVLLRYILARNQHKTLLLPRGCTHTHNRMLHALWNNAEGPLLHKHSWHFDDDNNSAKLIRTLQHCKFFIFHIPYFSVQISFGGTVFISLGCFKLLLCLFASHSCV